jgi:hypothetical protein
MSGGIALSASADLERRQQDRESETEDGWGDTLVRKGGHQLGKGGGWGEDTLGKCVGGEGGPQDGPQEDQGYPLTCSLTSTG